MNWSIPKPLPSNPLQNLEAERALIGSMLIDNRHIPTILNLLPPMCFRRDDGVEPLLSQWAHQEIFEAILNLYERDGGVDLVTLGDELDRRGRYAQVGGGAFLVGFEEEMLSTIYIPEYARIVFEKWQNRYLAALSEKMKATANGDRPGILAQMKLVENMRHGGEADRINRHLADWVTQIEARRVSPDPPGILTGMPELDRLTDGSRAGELWVFAGRPGHGKSICLLQLARLACHQGKPVYYLSLEMPREDVLARLVASEAQIPLKSLRRPENLTTGQQSRLHESNLRLGNWPLVIDDKPMDAETARAKAVRAVEGGHAKLVIVDYLQKFDPAPGRKGWDMRQQVAYASGAMKSLAMEAKIPVIVGAQVRRDVEQRQTTKRRRGDSMPRLSDLKESGAIEQDADVVVMMHRHGAESPPPLLCEEYDGETLFTLAKHRNGPTGRWDLRFNPETVTFEPPPMGHSQERSGA